MTCDVESQGAPSQVLLPRPSFASTSAAVCHKCSSQPAHTTTTATVTPSRVKGASRLNGSAVLSQVGGAKVTIAGAYDLKGKACCTEPAGYTTPIVQNSHFTHTLAKPNHQSTDSGAGVLGQLEENLWRNAERVMRVRECEVQLRLLQQGLVNTPYDTHSPESQLWNVIQGGISDDTYTV